MGTRTRITTALTSLLLTTGTALVGLHAPATAALVRTTSDLPTLSASSPECQQNPAGVRLRKPTFRQQDAYRLLDSHSNYSRYSRVYGVWNATTTPIKGGTAKARGITPTCFKVDLLAFGTKTHGDQWVTLRTVYVPTRYPGGAFGSWQFESVYDATYPNQAHDGARYLIRTYALRPGYAMSDFGSSSVMRPYDGNTIGFSKLCYLTGTVNTATQFLTTVTPALLKMSRLDDTPLGDMLESVNESSRKMLVKVAVQPGTSLSGDTRQAAYDAFKAVAKGERDRFADYVIISGQARDNTTGRLYGKGYATAQDIKTGVDVVVSLADAAQLLAAVPSMQDQVYQHCTF